MNLGLVIFGLCTARGGLERVGCDLANAMVERGHKATIYYHSDPKFPDVPVYPLHRSVAIAGLKLSSSRSLGATRALFLETGLDVLCALFSWDSLLWFPAILNNTGIPFLISEHSNPNVIENERWNRYERLACMAAADRIHVLQDQYREQLPEFLRERTTVIPNPVKPACPVDPERENSPRKTLLAVGRLVDNPKQFSMLIQAFAMLAPAFPDWQVILCGDGPDESSYRQLIDTLGLAGRVILHGRVEDIDSRYAASHLFCIPSRYEGFPLVPLEARRHGLPVVGFAGCSGTSGLVNSGHNGILVDEMSPAGLASGLRILMKNKEMRLGMGANGQKGLEAFAEKTIHDQWEELLLQTAGEKSRTRLMTPGPSEEQRIQAALEEILCREHPFVRPACADTAREADSLKKILQGMAKDRKTGREMP